MDDVIDISRSFGSIRPMAAMTINLDEAARSALDELAQRTGSSNDWLLSRAVEAYAAHEAWMLEKITSGIAAADGIDFAGEDEVERVRAKFAQPE